MMVDSSCNQLFENNCDLYAENLFNADRELIFSHPFLDEIWLFEPEH